MSLAKLKVLLLEPFFSGSHRHWAEGLQKNSIHQIEIWSLPGRHWKWRMHGAAVTFAQRYLNDKPSIDLIVCTDFMDLATFKGIAQPEVPILLYYHENQLAYPWSESDQDVKKKWDRRYIWINFTSALAASEVWFNSLYNYQSFLNQLPEFLMAFPDQKQFDLLQLKQKSKVVPLGLELPIIQKPILKNPAPIILWNHRWEYDKGPTLFFETLLALAEDGIFFNLMILGNHTNKYPSIFDEVRKSLAPQVKIWAPNTDRKSYWRYLTQADIVPVTSKQDFFGISVVEAIHAECKPLLPRGLAYGEHLNEKEFPEYFYDSPAEFKLKLKDLILYPEQYQELPPMTSYKWSSMITKYDKGFSNLLSNNQEK